jgi:hypothetical protein
MVLIIGKGLGRGDDDRISGMRAEWVEILHVAANNCVLDRRKIRPVNEPWTEMKKRLCTNIGAIPDDFILDFLPALHTALDEHLRGERKATRGKITEFVRIVGKTRAEPSKSES